MDNKKPLKGRGIGISDEMYDLMKLYSTRNGMSLSEFVRSALDKKIEKLKTEEEKFWSEISADKVTELLKSLSEYLEPKISSCDHNTIFRKDLPKNFKNTREFCQDLQIEFSAFLKRVESDLAMTFDCECELKNELINRRNENE